MDPVVISILIFFVADTVAYLATFIITRNVMGMAKNKVLVISSIVGMVVGLIAFLPYLFTHVLHAPQ